MISRTQQILVKRAQREAGLDDSDYREALELAAGCRSSTDPAMTDRGLDLMLGFLEAVYWRGVDAGTLPPPCRPDAVFRQPGFWARKNKRGETSRDRFNGSNLSREVLNLEIALAELGFGSSYCAAIRAKVAPGRTDDRSLRIYAVALHRTLRAKQRHRIAPELSNATPISAGPERG